MSSSYPTPRKHDRLRLPQVFRKTLLYSLIAGGVLLGVFAWLRPGAESAVAHANREVHITAQQVEWLKETWVRQWQRQPDERELKQLVNDYLREELLAREALALGLENGDRIGRRQLAQTMEFLVQNTARVAEPNEEELRRFLDTNRDKFQIPVRVSFSQVFVNRKKRGEAAVNDAREILWRLREDNAPTNMTQLGDQTSLSAEYSAQEERAVLDQFGADFARAVFASEPGRWFGPIESGYGLHIVRVTEKEVPQQKEFGEVRNAFPALSHEQQQRVREEQFYAALMKRYRVVFDESVRPLLEPSLLAREIGP
ncbi:peptidylprolyl isomerase [Verrucomicrobiota bacterium sgz303538]